MKPWEDDYSDSALPWEDDYDSPKSGSSTRTRRDIKEQKADQKIIEEFAEVDPAELTDNQRDTLRGALEREGIRARSASALAEDIYTGRKTDPMVQVGDAARTFTEGSLGLGDEAGALSHAVRSGGVLDVLFGDRSVEDLYNESIGASRESMEAFARANPDAAAALEAAGMVSGLAVPALGNAKVIDKVSEATGLSRAKSAGLVGAAEGAAYGAAAGEGEGRLEGALLGTAIGGVAGSALTKAGEKVSEKWQKIEEELRQKDLDRKAAEERGEWYDEGNANKTTSTITKLAVGVSDAVRRHVSKEAGGRIQRADETAMRQNTQDTDEYLNGGFTERGDTPRGVGGKSQGNPGFSQVLALEETDTAFAGHVLDYAKGDINRAQLMNKLDEALDNPDNAELLVGVRDKDVKHITKRMEQDGYSAKESNKADAVEALKQGEKARIRASLNKYLDWSEEQNALYNKMTGDSSLDARNYLHTSVRPEVSRRVIREQRLASEGEGTGVSVDTGELARSRGSYAKGEVDPRDYQSTFMANANRIFSNRREMELQKKFGIKQVEGGRRALVDAIKKTSMERGLSEDSATAVRNSVVTLLEGQERTANAWARAFQNIGYSVLAGPKSALINLHDLPVAIWNQGVKNVFGKGGMMSALSDSKFDNRTAEAIGINKQNVGEFVQELRGARVASTVGVGPLKLTRRAGLKKDATVGEKVENATGSVLDNLMRWSGFQWSDMKAKNGVIRTVANENVKRAKAGKLKERWGTYFDDAELKMLEKELKRVGDNLDDLSDEASALFDEMNTLGLGQQQLISAAGRPPSWLNNPNARPLWMMRGFAIKQNAMIIDKVADLMRKGDVSGAAKEMARFVAIPGSTYGGLNLIRQDMFGKEEYEPTTEEFLWSVADAVIGPATFNLVGLGNEYGRMKLAQNPAGEVMTGILPPLGYLENSGEAVVDAFKEGDPEKLLDVVIDQPLVKQWGRATGLIED